MAEVDRIVRPGGKLIVRDESKIFREVENLLKSLHWEVHVTISKNQEGLLSAQKGDWRPDTYVDSSWSWREHRFLVLVYMVLSDILKASIFSAVVIIEV